MSSDLLDLDDIAADDALIESIRSGAGRDDLPEGDSAVDVLLGLRDGAAAPAATPSAAARKRRLVASRVVAHRRAVAVAAVAGLAVTTGVGAAVAGDPAAAFKYVFDQGVEIGSRIGSPGGSSQAAGVGAPPHAVSVRTPPVRKGSAAAPLDDTEVDTTVGFVRDPDYWLVPTPRGLEQYTDGDSDSSGRDGLTASNGVTTTEAGPSSSPTTRGPVDATEDDSDVTDEPEVGAETEETDPTDGPTTTLIVPPTEGTTDPTTDPTTSSPTETTPPPTQTTPPPTETTEPPTETTPPPAETTPPPTETTSPPGTTSPPTSSSPSTTSSTTSDSPTP